MPPKDVAKYNSKGIFTILQLSHLFRPRRKGNRPKTSGHYAWDLKALALREKKTFVLCPPDLALNPVTIYLDFEGLPDNDFIYLIGVLIKQQDKEDKHISFWADGKHNEEGIFISLIEVLNKYPEAHIYHYGSYETKAIQKVLKQYHKNSIAGIEKRMTNLLSYFRSHVYPPTYTNSLKDIAPYLGFTWTDTAASGLMSIQWRKNWENTKLNIWKEKLLQYNKDDCIALAIVHTWLIQLTLDSTSEEVQFVAQMKKHTPFKLQNNKEYGEDFQVISKAAYFDYQRTKIYWRNESSRIKTTTKKKNKTFHPGKGIGTWQPKKANKIITIPPLKKCPYCGHTKIYRLGKRGSFIQTDLKFTPGGIKKYVVEFRSGQGKCAKCLIKHNDGVLRRMHYGDNLFAWVTDMYVNYNLSNYAISKMLEEQYSIIMRAMYLVMRKQKWWKQWQPEVDYIKKTILNSPVLHIDETSVKLSKDKGYVWAFATSHTVLYNFTPTREVDFLHDWLKDYNGIIVTDFFPGYDALNVKHQKCLIHLIRDLNDDLFKSPFDEEYKLMVLSFSKLLRSIIQTIDKYGLRKIKLQRHSKEIENYFNRFVTNNHTSELSVKYSKRLRKHWDELWTFIQYDNVPWNNNNAEAAIKSFALYRRCVNGQVSANGLHDYLPMLSIAQTCRYRNISFLDFLRHKAGIWQNIDPKTLPGFLPFHQARLYMHKQKFKQKKQWQDWEQSIKHPSFIPLRPDKIYHDKGWIDWRDWLGISTETIT